MNEQEIETLLRQAPEPKVPNALLPKLESQIRHSLPAEKSSIHFLHRWRAPLALAASLALCIVAVATQSVSIGRLKKQNAELSEKAAQRETGNLEAGGVDESELQRLRKASQDMPRLQEEIARLREQLKELPNLRAENARLRQVSRASTNAAESGDFFAQQKLQSEHIRCINNLKQIGLGARLFAKHHKDIYPANLEVIREILGTDKVMTCPSGNAYEILFRQEIMRDTPAAVITRCSIHGNIGLADGSVHEKISEDKLETKNGQLFLKQTRN